MMRPQPNLVFVWTDEQRPDTIGAYGNRQISTPNIDRLASTGALFEAAYCTQPVCSPARASVLTGVYPHTHGVNQNNVSLGTELPTLATLLRDAGYACGYVGKWHLGNEAGRIPPGRSGFDDLWVSTEDGYIRDHAKEGYTSYHDFLLAQGYTPRDGHRGGTIFARPTAARLPEEHGKPAYQAAECVRFLDARRDRPFLLMVNFLEPHQPFFGPWDNLYSPDDVRLPPSWYRDFEPTVPARYRLRQEALRHGLSLGEFDRLGSNDERGWKELVARYWGLASLVDKYVGQILDHIDALGLAGNTIIVFTSDHGDMMGEHRLVHKAVQFEGAVRVPLVIRVPGLRPRRLTTPVSHVSLLATLLDLLGQSQPDHLQGRSLLPLLTEGDSVLDGEDVVIEWNGTSGYTGVLAIPVPAGISEDELRQLQTLEARTIRRGRWKLTVNVERRARAVRPA